MNPQYFKQEVYRNRKIKPQILHSKITKKYIDFNLDEQYTFEQLLFYLDEQCQLNRCDRDVARQLFEQSATPQNKSSLNQMIFKYVQNLQTSKLCLMREQKGIQALTHKIDCLKGSKNCHVHLKIIQVTVYARYSSVPSFSYKISPSDIPPVTVINSLNPILNHEYTLKMDCEKFEIIFYESGIQIGKWQWPDYQYQSSQAKQYEHHRNINLQNLSFQLRLKYFPKNSDPKQIGLRRELSDRNIRQQNQRQAFKKLCYFQPFIDRQKQIPKPYVQNGKIWNFTEKFIECLPFLSEHIRNLYYIMILLMFVELLASIYWSMEFLDIALAFYVISILYDQSEYELGMELWGAMMALVIFIVKSIWGAATTTVKGEYLIVFLVFAIVIKFLAIFFIWITAVRKSEIPAQRIQQFYDGVDPKYGHHNQLNNSSDQHDQSIFY